MRKLVNKTNVDSPDSDFPFGRIRDNPGDSSGTPVNELLYGDIHQFFEKLFSESGLVANELPENDYNGFQLFEALRLSALPYHAYSANLTQVTTGAPSAVVMPGNNIGAIVWTRANTGSYTGTLVGAFSDASKVWVNVSGVDGIAKIVCNGANTIGLLTLDYSGTPTDGILNETSIEIRVYN